jgi:hypothetical protein
MRDSRALACTALVMALAGCAELEEQGLEQAVTSSCDLGGTTPGRYFVATDGDDSHPGTVLLPWATIGTSVNRLVPGDTLCVRGGAYHETGITMNVSGTATSPITIRSVPGEQPVIDGALPTFQTFGHVRWTLHDPVRHVYRSVDTFPATDFAFIGGEIEASGETFKLVGYLNRSGEDFAHTGYEYLTSDYHDYDRRSPRYLGPGVAYFDDGTGGRIYIRLEPPAASALAISQPYPSWYTDYTSRFFDAATFDPNGYRIHIFGTGPALRPNADHVIVDGIDIVHHQTGMLRMNTQGVGSDWTFKDLTFAVAQTALLVRTATHDLMVDSVTFEGRLPMWISQNDIKGAENVAASIQAVAMSVESGVSGITVQASTFNHLYDGIILAGGSGPAEQHDHTIIHNVANDIRDDFVQLASKAYNVEIAYNLVEGAGVSHQAAGEQPAEHAGTKYIHHNIIDASMPKLGTRNDPKNWTDGARNWSSPNPLSRHFEGTCDGGDPWKLYQNTFVIGNGTAGGFFGAFLFSTGGMNNSTGSRHEVYNNIFYEVVSADDASRRTRLMRKWQVAEPFEIYDGNLYSMPPGVANAWILFEVENTSTTRNYLHLADFVDLANPDFLATRTPESPDGWESHGVEADPQLADIASSDYRPLPGSPALTGAVDLSSKPWPGVGANEWRGALPGITPPVDQLVGYWPFDEGVGTIAHDVSGHGNDGSLINGPAWTPGATGARALDFDDVDDYVSVPDNALLDFGADTNFSITAWIRTDAPSNLGNIVMKGSAGTGGKRYQLQVYSTGRLMVVVDDDITERILSSTDRVDDGNWHFVAATFDRNGYMYLYVDGSSTWTRRDIASAASLDDVSQPLKIGGTSQYFHGAIDEVRVYRDKILGAAEIDGLAQEGP